ncbi:MAG TPA: hypothetical protein VMP08_16640 [Anaerolineae bacterium]|nr:hypothetical protein [Anaerolineae bacterium]
MHVEWHEVKANKDHMEPLSVAEKGIEQAYEIQRRLKVWRPVKAAVVGVGPLGLLATLALRLRGLKVTALARSEPPTLNSQLVEAIGARYISTKQISLLQAAEKYGPFDVIFEATGLQWRQPYGRSTGRSHLAGFRAGQ